MHAYVWRGVLPVETMPINVKCKPLCVVGLSKAGKAKIPPERFIIYFPKFLNKYSWGWIPKRIAVGDVPQSLMPVYMPCKRAATITVKTVQQHWWKVLLALAAIFFVAWLIKWEPPPGLGLPRQHGSNVQVPLVPGPPVVRL